MSWTTPADLRAQVQRLWDQGRLLGCLIDAGDLFPFRLVLKAPTSSELSERFADAQAWAQALDRGAKQGFRLVHREVRHRVIGANAVPAEVWVDTLDSALALIGKRGEAKVFLQLVTHASSAQPALLPWLARCSLRALALEPAWPRLVDIVTWLQAHPRPGIYLRQVDLPGIDTKFIESHRAVLAELLDAALPVSAIDMRFSGMAQFAPRYGFKSKPVRVRLRVLDPACALLAAGSAEDLTLDQASFARLDAASVKQVFITENETNFLAFPPAAASVVVFGSGYGFDKLAEARWLEHKTIRYWGDIDTHGFAILNELRSHFAHVESLLMDRETLLAHREHWTDEPQPTLRDLPHLNPAERSLYDDLRWKRLADRALRLEQERIGFHAVEQAVTQAVAA